MAFVSFPTACQLEARFIYDGQHVENVHHFDTATTLWTAESMNDLAERYRLLWDGSFKPYAPPTLSLESIVVRSLSTSSSPAVEYTTSLPIAGTNAGPQLPNNVTYAVKWTTGLSGRSYRGRTYHIGLNESQVIGNNLDGTYRIAMVAAYSQFPAWFAAEDAIFVIASRVSDGAERSPGITTPVVGCTIDPVIDSQRRRLPGRGA